jgi:hypothetical protein
METNIIQELPKNKIIEFVDDLPSFQSSTDLVPTDFQRSIEPVHVELTEGTAEEELEADFASIRQNLAEVSQRANQGIEKLMELAVSSESPRAYEVFVSAVTAMANANKDLLDAHAKRADIKKKLAAVNPLVPDNQTNIQNNNVFVGSTSDLLDMLNRK